MSKLSKIIGRPLFEAAALPGWKNDYGKVFTCRITDKGVAAKVIDALDLEPVSDTQWQNYTIGGITMVDYSKFSGEVLFSLGCEGVKAMKLADKAIDKASNSQGSTEINLKALAAKKSEIRKVTLDLQREKQMNRKVELNAKLRQLNAELAKLLTAPDSVPAAFGEANSAGSYIKWSVLNSNHLYYVTGTFSNYQLFMELKKSLHLSRDFAISKKEDVNNIWGDAGLYIEEYKNGGGYKLHTNRKDLKPLVVKMEKEFRERVPHPAPDSVPAAFGEAKAKFNLKWIKRKDCHYAIINHIQAMAVVKALGMVENRRVSLTQYDRVTGNDSEYIHLVFRELSSEGRMYNIEARSDTSRREIETAVDRAGDSVPAAFGESQILEATALPGWKVQGNGSLADKFVRIVDDRDVAMKFIKALNLPKIGDMSWAVLQPLFIYVDDYSEMQGKPHFCIMVKGAKAMKTADGALSKILNPQASEDTVKAMAKLKKEIARVQNLANKERQMNMRVEYGSQLRKLNAELALLEKPAPDSVPAAFGENINQKQKTMSRLNRVFGNVDTDPTDGMLENLNPDNNPIQEDDDDLGLIQLPELPEDHVTLPESLRKELLRAAQCDSTTLALKTKHAYLSEGFISTEVAAITDVTVREAIEELGAPDYVLLKEGVYTELLIVTPLLPMAESVSAKKSRDWRQVSIEDVPHLYLKF